MPFSVLNAAVDYGTAIGVIRVAHEQGKKNHVFLDETRLRLQGASLSAYEMKAFGLPHTVIVDGASGYVMSIYPPYDENLKQFFS